jgi:hypothetical protein
VIVPVLSVVNEPVVAVKFTDEAPAGTVTDDGTVMRVVLRVIETDVADGTAPEKTTVQVALLSEPTVEGAHVNPLRVTVPPAAATDTTPFVVANGEVRFPAPDAAVTLVTVRIRDVLADPVDGVAKTEAATPSAIRFWFRPQTAQSSLPEVERHFRLLLLPVTAAPAAIVTEENSDAEYVIENSSALRPPRDPTLLRERLRETPTPGEVAAEPKARVAV